MDIDRYSPKLSQFESRTKDDMAWRLEKKEARVWQEVDTYHLKDWYESTITDIKLHDLPGRPGVPHVKIGFRVYRENARNYSLDQYGKYSGYGSQYDKWYPLFSPNIQPYLSRSAGRRSKQYDLQDEFDAVVEPQEGHSQVYIIPRVQYCTSRLFCDLLNNFGNENGFEMILDVLENGESGPDLTLPTLAYLTTLISMPGKMWNLEYIKVFGPRVIKAAKKQFLDSADKSIRGIDPGIIS